MSDVLAPARGITRNLAAFVVGAAFAYSGRRAAYALGDGTLRLVDLHDPAGEWLTVQAHDGAVLSLAAAGEGFVSGGDDGRFVQVNEAGAVQEIASFGGKWVEHAASVQDGKSGVLACAAGKFAHLFSASGEKLRSLEHPSTVTGLSFDAKGKRIAASHYNGASLWFVASKSATPRRLEWKGSHTNVALHPAAEAVVSCMQENALHGWRLPDAHDMRMSGYPSKPESLSFTRNGRWLASSGADATVLWPFFGGGPMGKPPLELAQREGTVCTRVACHPSEDFVAAGYSDGAVLLADIASRGAVKLGAPGIGPISALAWSSDGKWLSFGTEQGVCVIINVAEKS